MNNPLVDPGIEVFIWMLISFATPIILILVVWLIVRNNKKNRNNTPKNLKRCSKCGSDGYGNFCAECGSPMAVEGPKKCLRCGTNTTGQFCPNCGSRVE